MLKVHTWVKGPESWWLALTCSDGGDGFLMIVMYFGVALRFLVFPWSSGSLGCLYCHLITNTHYIPILLREF